MLECNSKRHSLLLRGCLLLIKFYQWVLRPFLSLFIGTPAGACRFTPSCSHYAVEAFRSRGVVRGFYLTAKRILRCHPGAKGGWDPVEGSEN